METKEMAMSIAKAMAAPMQSAMTEICNKIYAQLDAEHKADIEKRNKFFTEQYNALEEERARLDDELVKCKADYGKKLADALADVDALKKALEAKGNEPVGKATGTETAPSASSATSKVKNFIKHHLYDKIYLKVKKGRHVYLNGEAGTGKNVIAEQIAMDLGLEFYMSSKLCDEYGLCGFVDANGHYIDTPFFHAFCYGGLFLFDEFDASDENAVTAINSALANGYYTFPKIGKVYAHENFRCIANGNTTGNGSDSKYTGRRCLDKSTLDRFSFVTVDYDEHIELCCAKNDKELVDFVHDLRKASAKCGVDMLCSYRSISMVKSDLDDAEYMKHDTIGGVLDSNIFKGVNKDNILNIYENMEKKHNKYAKAMSNYAWGLEKEAA